MIFILLKMVDVLFNGWAIGIAFVLALFGTYALEFFGSKDKFLLLLKASALIILICGFYCIVSGLYLAVGWEDPLMEASSEDIASASAKHGGKGGIAILAIRFWPYVLILIGAMQSFNSINALLAARGK